MYREVWQAYVKANGPLLFWLAFVLVFVGQKAVDIGETAWCLQFHDSHILAEHIS